MQHMLRIFDENSNRKLIETLTCRTDSFEGVNL
jgi:hypothetical protein